MREVSFWLCSHMGRGCEKKGWHGTGWASTRRERPAQLHGITSYHAAEQNSGQNRSQKEGVVQHFQGSSSAICGPWHPDLNLNQHPTRLHMLGSLYPVTSSELFLSHACLSFTPVTVPHHACLSSKPSLTPSPSPGSSHFHISYPLSRADWSSKRLSSQGYVPRCHCESRLRELSGCPNCVQSSSSHEPPTQDKISNVVPHETNEWQASVSATASEDRSRASDSPPPNRG